MTEYEIWIEGFAATGQHQKAHLIGKSKGNTFKEACENFRHPEDIMKYDGTEVLVKKGTPLSLDEDREAPSIWACKLHDNEQDARKAFG